MLATWAQSSLQIRLSLNQLSRVNLVGTWYRRSNNQMGRDALNWGAGGEESMYWIIKCTVVKAQALPSQCL